MKTTIISENESTGLLKMHEESAKTYLQVGAWLGTSASFVCNALRGYAKFSPEQVAALRNFYAVAIAQRVKQQAAAVGVAGDSETPGKGHAGK